MAIIPDDPKQRNALLVAVALVAAFYFFHAYWYSPRAEEVETMAENLEQLENRNRQAQIIAARGGSQLEERMVLYERHVGRLEQLIPARDEVAVLLESVTRQAQVDGVDLASIRPASTEQGEFYTRQVYDLTVVGEYHDVARFLSSIASLPRIITPTRLDLVRFTNPRGALDYESPVEATFQIETYVLPEEGRSQGEAGATAASGGDR